MPETAPTTRSLTLHKYLYLKHKLKRDKAWFVRPAAEDLLAFNEIRSVAEPIINKELSNTHA